MAYTGNTACLPSEDDRGLWRSINYLKVISAVIDKLETVRRSHEAVLVSKSIETEYFKMQDELTDCFRQLDALKNINSAVKEAKQNLSQKAQALQRMMDELCLQGGNDIFAIGSSHAVHSECGSNDVGHSRIGKRLVNTIVESDSSSEPASDRILKQLQSDRMRLFRRPEINGNMAYRDIEEERHFNREEENVRAAAGGVIEAAGEGEPVEIERDHEEVSSSTKRSRGFLGKKSRRSHGNSQGSENRKSGTVRKFFRKFTKYFRVEGYI